MTDITPNNQNQDRKYTDFSNMNQSNNQQQEVFQAEEQSVFLEDQDGNIYTPLKRIDRPVSPPRGENKTTVQSKKQKVPVRRTVISKSPVRAQPLIVSQAPAQPMMISQPLVLPQNYLQMMPVTQPNYQPIIQQQPILQPQQMIQTIQPIPQQQAVQLIQQAPQQVVQQQVEVVEKPIYYEKEVIIDNQEELEKLNQEQQEHENHINRLLVDIQGLQNALEDERKDTQYWRQLYEVKQQEQLNNYQEQQVDEQIKRHGQHSTSSNQEEIQRLQNIISDLRLQLTNLPVREVQVEKIVYKEDSEKINRLIVEIQSLQKALIEQRSEADHWRIQYEEQIKEFSNLQVQLTKLQTQYDELLSTQYNQQITSNHQIQVSHPQQPKVDDQQPTLEEEGEDKRDAIIRQLEEDKVKLSILVENLRLQQSSQQQIIKPTNEKIIEKQVYVEDVSKINRLLVEIQSFQTVLTTKQDEIDQYKRLYEEQCLRVKELENQKQIVQVTEVKAEPEVKLSKTIETVERTNEKTVYVEDISKINRLLVEIQSFQTVIQEKNKEVEHWKSLYDTKDKEFLAVQSSLKEENSLLVQELEQLRIKLDNNYVNLSLSQSKSVDINKIERLIVEIQSLEKALIATQNDVKSRDQEIDQLKVIIRGLEEKLLASNSEQREKIEKLIQELETLHQAYVKEREAGQESSSQSQQYLSEIDRLKGLLDSQQKEVLEVKQEETVYVEDISKLDRLIVEIQSLHQALIEERKEVDRYKELLAIKQREIDQLRQSQPQVRVEREVVYVENNEAVQRLERQVSEVTQQVEVWRSRYELLQRENTSSTDLQYYQNKVQELEKEIVLLREQNSRYLQYDLDIERLNQKIREQEQEIQRLTQQSFRCTQLEIEISRLTQKISRMSELEQEINNLNQKNSRISTLEVRIQGLKEENQQLRDQIEEWKAKFVLAGLEIESLRTYNGVELRIIEELVRFPNQTEDDKAQIISQSTNQQSYLSPEGKRRYEGLKETIMPEKRSTFVNNQFTDQITNQRVTLSPMPKQQLQSYDGEQ